METKPNQNRGHRLIAKTKIMKSSTVGVGCKHTVKTLQIFDDFGTATLAVQVHLQDNSDETAVFLLGSSIAVVLLLLAFILVLLLLQQQQQKVKDKRSEE